MFTEKQLAEFKEAFSLMDHDKDGILSRNDLRYIFDQVGRPVSNQELEEMVGEAAGPINFTQLLQLFASRMSGGGEWYTPKIYISMMSEKVEFDDLE